MKITNLFNLEDKINTYLKTSPLLVKDDLTKAKVEILTTSREIKHLKKQFWKFSHK